MLKFRVKVFIFCLLTLLLSNLVYAQTFFLKEQFMDWLYRSQQTHFLENSWRVDSILEDFLRNRAVFTSEVEYEHDYLELIARFPAAPILSKNELQELGTYSQVRWIQDWENDSLNYLNCQLYFHEILAITPSTPPSKAPDINLLKTFLEGGQTHYEAYALWRGKFEPNHTRVIDTCNYLRQIYDHEMSLSPIFDRPQGAPDQSHSKKRPKATPPQEEQPEEEQSNKNKFLCREPGCSASYASRWGLNRHGRKVHGGTQFKCTVPGCKGSFVERFKLTRHLKRQHGLETPAGNLRQKNNSSYCGAGGGKFFEFKITGSLLD